MDPSSELYLPSNAGEVVRVDGLCYELVGEVDAPPEDIIVDGVFETCAECESSSVLASSEVPSSLIASSGIASSGIASSGIASSGIDTSSTILDSSTTLASSTIPDTSSEIAVGGSSGDILNEGSSNNVVAVYGPCDQSSGIPDTSSDVLDSSGIPDTSSALDTSSLIEASSDVPDTSSDVPDTSSLIEAGDPPAPASCPADPWQGFWPSWSNNPQDGLYAEYTVAATYFTEYFASGDCSGVPTSDDGVLNVNNTFSATTECLWDNQSSQFLFLSAGEWNLDLNNGPNALRDTGLGPEGPWPDQVQCAADGPNSIRTTYTNITVTAI